MKSLSRLIAVLAGIAIGPLVLAPLPAAASPQDLGTTPVQQSPTHMDACTPINNKGATNGLASVTLTCPASSPWIYLCGVSFDVVNTSTGIVTQAQVCFTTANFNGLQWCYSSANAANSFITLNPPLPAAFVKSASPSPTVTTISSPAVNAQILYNINAYYSCGQG